MRLTHPAMYQFRLYSALAASLLAHWHVGMRCVQLPMSTISAFRTWCRSSLSLFSNILSPRTQWSFSLSLSRSFLAFGHTLCSMKDKLSSLYSQESKKGSYNGIMIKLEWLLQQQQQQQQQLYRSSRTCMRNVFLTLHSSPGLHPSALRAAMSSPSPRI